MFKKKNRNSSLLGIIFGASSIATLALGSVLLYYLKSRNSEAKLIPSSVEGRIDKVIEVLNKKFGKRWVNRGVSVLETGLESMLPAPLVALVSVVHRVEHQSEQQAWSGQEKRAQAMAMA